MEQLIHSSGVHKWIKNGWQELSEAEKKNIEVRVDKLFENGLPINLEHEKIIYTSIFAMLTQFGILSINISLQLHNTLTDKHLSEMMRKQLIDKIFHTIVFTKIAYDLGSYFAFPNSYNDKIEKICAFIKHESEFSGTIQLLNLISEGWIEEVFILFSKKDFAPKIFKEILKDQQRHVAEAKQYQFASNEKIKCHLERLELIENELVSEVFFQRKNLVALINIIGAPSCIRLAARIYKKHQKQLKKIGLAPTKQWNNLKEIIPVLIQQASYDHSKDTRISETLTRKVLMNAWEIPKDPTMFSSFSLDVTKLDIFNGKYPSHTITGLMLQTMSKLRADYPELRNYISNNKLFNAKNNHVHLVVQLPTNGNHLANIKFKDCHTLSLHDLSEKVINTIEIMSYCKYKADELAKAHPELDTNFYDYYLRHDNDIFSDLYPPHPVSSLSNVGIFGYESAYSPLLPFETQKFTICEVDKKQVWDRKTSSFVIRDLLPVGVSVDHRVFDGNMSLKKMTQIAFDDMLSKLEGDEIKIEKKKKPRKFDEFINFAEEIIQHNRVFAFRFLKLSSQLWNCDLDPNNIYKKKTPPKILVDNLINNLKSSA